MLLVKTAYQPVNKSIDLNQSTDNELHQIHSNTFTQHHMLQLHMMAETSPLSIRVYYRQCQTIQQC